MHLLMVSVTHAIQLIDTCRSLLIYYILLFFVIITTVFTSSRAGITVRRCVLKNIDDKT